jgi:hypothetical protein
MRLTRRPAAAGEAGECSRTRAVVQSARAAAAGTAERSARSDSAQFAARWQLAMPSTGCVSLRTVLYHPKPSQRIEYTSGHNNVILGFCTSRFISAKSGGWRGLTLPVNSWTPGSSEFTKRPETGFST